MTAVSVPAVRRPSFPWPALGAVAAAALLRALPLLQNRFHPDEALYAYFGRLIASGWDPLLAQVVVDKPPLFLYLLGGSFAAFGGSEFAARLPNFFGALLGVALVYRLARRLYGPRAAALAAGLLALSPLAILFSITLFIDPLLAVCGLWGLWQAAAGRPRWAAVALALGFALKQTAVFYLPLALAFGLLALPASAGPRAALARLGRLAGPLLAGLLIAGLVVFAWDGLRQRFGASISFWDQGYSDNVPDRLVRAAEVPLRAAAWWELGGYLTAAPLVNALAALGGVGVLWAGARRPSRAALADWLLGGYLLGYFAAYWLLAFNVWDRYVVPVAPLLLLLIARGLEGLAVRVCAWRPARAVGLAGRGGWLAAGMALLVLPAAFTAARSGYPVGGDHGAYMGLDDAARFLNALPYGAVLYDFWLSWEWNYYLFDGKVYTAWLPAPEALTADLRAFGRTSPRYLAVPSWESEAEARTAAAAAGFTFELAHAAFRADGSRSFAIYRLIPAAAP